MDHIRGSDDWHKLQRTSPGGLYDRCVREMDRVSINRITVTAPNNTDETISDCVPSAVVLLAAICLSLKYP
jgi:hypothetical protein